MYNSASHIDNIMLEPRLQEYMTRKKYYRENNINPNVPLEKEFRITQQDIRLINSYLDGKKNLYNNKYNNNKYNNNKFDDNSNTTSVFPSKEFRDNNPKVPKIKKEIYKQPVNMGMFAPDKPGDSFYDSSVNISIGTDPILDNLTQRDLSYKYNKKLTSATFDNNNNDNNRHYKIETEKMNDLISNYQMQQFSDDRIDIHMQNTMLKSQPSDSRIRNKSNGYRNPEEYNYNRFSEDFIGETAVEPWARGGVQTRLENKKIMRKPYERDVL